MSRELLGDIQNSFNLKNAVGRVAGITSFMMTFCFADYKLKRRPRVAARTASESQV
jgi:hypothetical protein